MRADQRPTAMRRLAVVAVLVLTLVGCGQGSVTGAVAGPSPSTQPTPSATNTLADCPSLPSPKPGSAVAVEFVDYVQENGVLFVADQDGTLVVSGSDAGPAQFTVRCSLAQLNDLTSQEPPAPRDHDASYLKPGTPVYAEKGWPPSCRLIAQNDGGWRTYRANTSSGELVPCAAQPSVTPSTVASVKGPYGDCHSKPLPPGETNGPGDFSDFLTHDGAGYQGDYGLGHARLSQRGAEQFRVACSFSAFDNSLFDGGAREQAVSGDNDAAFLPARAPVYAVHGFSPRCKLMALENAQWVFFTATGPGCASPAPIATSLPPRL